MSQISWSDKLKGKTPTFHVAKNWHSKLSGPRGDHIVKAQQQFSVKIIIPPRENSMTGIIVEGKEESIVETIKYFEKILGFQLGKEPLTQKKISLTIKEIEKILGEKQKFFATVLKYGAGVLFPRQGSNDATIIQAREQDVIGVINEFSSIVGRAIKAEEDKVIEVIAKSTIISELNDELNEVLFFHPFEDDDMYDHERFLELLASAERTLDICVFTITDNRIKYVLEKEHRQGTKIRLITDNSQALTLGSDANDLKKIGIPVKVDYDPSEESHMHHKFCIVDNRFIMTGSFNWTKSAESKNYENILITSNKKLVKQYADYFEKLWNRDKSIVDINSYKMAKTKTFNQ